MNDRELLEAAARAVGLRFECYHDGDRKGLELVYGDIWNPLTDDGEALRLAVNLNMHVSIGQVDYWLNDNFVCEFSSPEAIDADPYAATRRAIVRAAAEMG